MQGERDREVSTNVYQLIYFPPKCPQCLDSAWNWNQDPGTQPKSPTQVSGTQLLWPLSPSFRACFVGKLQSGA